MVGSRDSIASPNIVLNTIVAEAFCQACDELEKGENFEEDVHDLIKKYLTEHQRIVFNGNGYAPEWVEEAARRGLPNITSMVDAIPYLITENDGGAVRQVRGIHQGGAGIPGGDQYESYAKAINIEARTMIDMASKQIIPGGDQIHQKPGGYCAGRKGRREWIRRCRANCWRSAAPFCPIPETPWPI